MKSYLIALMLALVFPIVQAAHAAEVSLSGFGTVGYAISDKEYDYQRFINDNGTLKRDTVMGVQADVKINEQFRITLQGKLAPSEKNDTDWVPDISWAFLSYRPSNDWLFRLGKLRVPMYLNSENVDVGVTHDMARLPAEMYLLSPINDMLGISVSKTWSPAIGEFMLESYWGKAPFYWRVYMRDDATMLGGMTQGANFWPMDMESTGMVMTFQRNSSIFRAGIHYAIAQMKDGSPLNERYTLQPVYLPTPAGLMRVGDAYQYDTPNLSHSIRNIVYVLGCDIDLGLDFRLLAEYGRRSIPDFDGAPDSQGGYVALLRKMGKWTPYISVSRLLSAEKVRSMFESINSYQIQGPADFLNVTQHQLVDSINAYDQYTWAVGLSYHLTPKQKIKAEWAQNRIKDMSALIDNPPGARISDTDINVFSISYNFVF